ncbi:MAG: hypothetical protein AAGB24_11425 [Bacteroidota bacterium]
MKPKIRRELFQSIGTATALIVSVLALIVSIYEANLLKAQQKATVWPYFSVNEGYDAAGFRINASNNGTGPALISSVLVECNGKPFKKYIDLLNTIKPNNTMGYDKIRVSNISNTVVKAGEERELLFLPWSDETREILKLMGGKVRIKIQYCSVLEDCWTYEYPTAERVKEYFKSPMEFDD